MTRQTNEERQKIVDQCHMQPVRVFLSVCQRGRGIRLAHGGCFRPAGRGRLVQTRARVHGQYCARAAGAREPAGMGTPLGIASASYLRVAALIKAGSSLVLFSGRCTCGARPSLNHERAPCTYVRL